MSTATCCSALSPTGIASTSRYIPFTAQVRRTIYEQAVATQRISDAAVEVRFIRWSSASPDGKTLAFQALGRIWLQSLPAGTPRRLAPVTFEPFEFQPAWSPDGRMIAFTTVDSVNRGALWRVAASGRTPARATREAGEYMNPSWTRDGREIVVARGAGATARGEPRTRHGWWDIVRLPASGGEETEITQARRVGNRDIEL
ncbi:MAG: hypothetical protein ABIW79_03005 [Gemmatimonas sp.]